jgi:hypothetical protein
MFQQFCQSNGWRFLIVLTRSFASRFFLLLRFLKRFPQNDFLVSVVLISCKRRLSEKSFIGLYVCVSVMFCNSECAMYRYAHTYVLKN